MDIKNALEYLNVKFYTVKLYQVGGCIRDELLGEKSKDIDYSVVIESKNPNDIVSIEKGLEFLERYLISHGYTIFLKTPDTFTFRARNSNTGEIADFVLAKHELENDESSPKPKVILGTLEQDLARRDFTINAMARDDSGNLIDLFGGQKDLSNKILRTPLNPIITLLDDPLRIFRALRFAITKELVFDEKLAEAFKNPIIYEKLWRVVSTDRIRQELTKMFAYSSAKSLELLISFSQEIKPIYPTFLSELFIRTGLWLKPTSEKIKFN